MLIRYYEYKDIAKKLIDNVRMFLASFEYQGRLSAIKNN